MQSEPWAVFYDIFVRNAFGDFRTLLKDIAYSPLMGDWLTFMGNKGYHVDQQYPDEK
jgi:hypothetical protein